MLYNSNPDKYKQILPGIKLKTLVYGTHSLLSEFIMNKGSVLPKHSHNNEQTGYLIKGKMILLIGDTPFEANAGDSWSIKSNVEHSAKVIEDSVAIEVFTPIREDYLPQNLYQ